MRVVTQIEILCARSASLRCLFLESFSPQRPELTETMQRKKLGITIQMRKLLTITETIGGLLAEIPLAQP